MSAISVTPVVLTYNEEPNIGRTLDSLRWANRVVVLDSGSTDATKRIAESYPNVAWFERPFDNHRAQWTYAVRDTAIDTRFALALDADMSVDTEFVAELASVASAAEWAGAWVPFEYRVAGQSLGGSIYPAQIRLFPPSGVRVDQAGHTQEFSAEGTLYRFKARAIHDDRKPAERWLSNQVKYARLEAARIRNAGSSRLKDRLRTLGVSPAVWGAYAYLKAGGPFVSPGARAYAYERMTFEAILARMLAEPSSDSVAGNAGGERART